MEAPNVFNSLLGLNMINRKLQFNILAIIASLFISTLVLISGCSSFGPISRMKHNIYRHTTEPKPIDNREKWKALAPFVKNHFDTGNKTLEEIAADLSLAEYLSEKSLE